MNWGDLIESPEWREIVLTIQTRESTILIELGMPEATKTLEEVRALQAELRTCGWLKSLPENIMNELIQDRKGKE